MKEKKVSIEDQPSQTGRRRFMGQVATAITATVLPGTLNAGIYPTTNHRLLSVSDPAKKFVPVMITPYAPDGKIDFGTLSKLTDFYMEAGASGFFANCLSSEMYQLDAPERLALARHVVKHVNGQLPVVASGSFGNSIAERSEFTKAMYHTGVNAVILISSHFAEREESDDTLISHFDAFMKMTDNIPLGTYECPSPYKRVLNAKVFSYLVSTGRLIYHKDTTLDTGLIAEKLELAKNTRLELYDAHTPNGTESLKLGARGISAIAGNFYPELFSWLCKNVNDPSKQEDVRWLQAGLTRMDSVISSGYPMSAKYFLSKRGVPFNLVCRSNPNVLTTQQVTNLDNFYRDLPAWHERLGIRMRS